MKNKIIMNKILDDLGILHPKTFYYPFKRLPRSKKRECVVKYEYGERGRNVKIYTFRETRKLVKIKKISQKHLIQEFIPFEKEYRVVVDFVGVIGIKEKKGTAKRKNYFNCKWEEVDNIRLSIFALDVVEKFGVDFTGLDIGLKDGKYYVIELNSAPGISRELAEIFAEHLIDLGDGNIILE